MKSSGTNGAKIPEPIKPILFIIWREAAALSAAQRMAEEAWGSIDWTGADFPFDLTKYYEEEMGQGLSRRVISFQNLTSPDFLVEARHTAGRIEDALRHEGRRRVNLDIGYLDLHKIVLGSTKPAGQKIYLAQGVYADLVARFGSGRYQPFEWTFPDIRAGRYDADLLTIRQLHREQLRKARAQS